jgi:hypothetical protein
MVTNKSNPDLLENEQFLLTGRLSAASRHAEGVTQLFFGFPFTKVLLHTVIEPQSENNREIRKAEQFLTLPTVTAIELANLILGTAKQAEEQLLKDLNENAREKVRDILQNYQAHNPIQGFESEQLTSTPPASSKKRK